KNTCFYVFRQSKCNRATNKISKYAKTSQTFIAFVPFLFCFSWRLSTETVNGKILSESGESLSSVTVIVENITSGQQRMLLTDSSGIFSIPNLHPGQRYNLYFEHVGYQRDSLNNYLVSNNENSLLL